MGITRTLKDYTYTQGTPTSALPVIVGCRAVETHQPRLTMSERVERGADINTTPGAHCHVQIVRAMHCTPSDDRETNLGRRFPQTLLGEAVHC